MGKFHGAGFWTPRNALTSSDFVASCNERLAIFHFVGLSFFLRKPFLTSAMHSLKFSKLLPGATSWRIGLFYFFATFAVERGSFTFFLNEHGYSATQVGMLQILFSSSLFLLEIPTGFFADRYGRVLSLVIGSLFKAGSLLSQFFFVDHGSAMALCFILNAAGFSFISGSFSAVLFRRMQEEGNEAEFGRVMSIVQFGGSLALGMAMVAAGPVLKMNGWLGVYGISAICSLLAAIPVLPLIWREKQAKNERTEVPIFYSFWHELKHIFPKALPFAMVHAAMTPYFVYGSVLLNRLGLAQGDASAAVGMVEIVGAVFVVLVIGRLGEIKMQRIPVLIFLFASVMIFNVQYSLYQAILAFAFSNFIVLLFEVVASQYLNSEIRQEQVRASTLSAISFIDMIFISSGFAIYGVLSELYSPQVALSCLALFPMMAALLFGVRTATLRAAVVAG
jgi:MFS family permease